MKNATSIYELEKCGLIKTFNSEKEACNFIGVKQSVVASCFRSNCKCKGWNVKRIGLSTHGETNTRLFRIWGGMRERCMRKKHPHYHNYGGRGICVCDEWMTYENFRDWSLCNGYTDKLTIDRIDVNGNYEPKNCRWITDKEQHNNKRTNHFVEVFGEIITISQCAEKYNKPKSTIRYWDDNGLLGDKLSGADMRGKPHEQ